MNEWTWFYDDYDRGTVFITADPAGDQTAIAEGLSPEAAVRIVHAHNIAVGVSSRYHDYAHTAFVQIASGHDYVEARLIAHEAASVNVAALAEVVGR